MIYFILGSPTYSLTDVTFSYKKKLWVSRKNDKVVKIMIKTNILIMENNSRLKKVKGLVLGLGFFYFIPNSSPLTRDVICFRLYLDGEKMRKQCQMNTLLKKFFLTFKSHGLLCFPFELLKIASAKKNESMRAYLLIFATKQKDLQFASLLVKIACIIFCQ